MSKQKPMGLILESLPRLKPLELENVNKIVGEMLRSREYNETRVQGLDQDVHDFYAAFCRVLAIDHDPMVMATRLRTIGKRKLIQAQSAATKPFVKWRQLKRVTHIHLYRMYMEAANDLCRDRQGRSDSVETISGRLMGVIDQLRETAPPRVIRVLQDIRGDLKEVLSPSVSTKELMGVVSNARAVWNHAFPGYYELGLLQLAAQRLDTIGVFDADP